jgi:preprotein translocase subunit SecE
MQVAVKINEFLLWVVVLIETGFGFYLTYSFGFSSPIIAMIWIAWVGLTGLLIYFTKPGQAVFAFSKEAKIELQKVVWPTRQETVQTTGVVMAMVGLTGIALWGLDSLMMWIIAKLTHLG